LATWLNDRGLTAESNLTDSQADELIQTLELDDFMGSSNFCDMDNLTARMDENHWVNGKLLQNIKFHSNQVLYF